MCDFCELCKCLRWTWSDFDKFLVFFVVVQCNATTECKVSHRVDLKSLSKGISQISMLNFTCKCGNTVCHWIGLNFAITLDIATIRTHWDSWTDQLRTPCLLIKMSNTWIQTLSHAYSLKWWWFCINTHKHHQTHVRTYCDKIIKFVVNWLSSIVFHHLKIVTNWQSSPRLCELSI